MLERRFYKKSSSYKLSEIIKLIENELVSLPTNYEDILIHDMRTLQEARLGDISFLINNKYLSQLQET